MAAAARDKQTFVPLFAVRRPLHLQMHLRSLSELPTLRPQKTRPIHDVLLHRKTLPQSANIRITIVPKLYLYRKTLVSSTNKYTFTIYYRLTGATRVGISLASHASGSTSGVPASESAPACGGGSPCTCCTAAPRASLGSSACTSSAPFPSLSSCRPGRPKRFSVREMRGSLTSQLS